MDAWTLVNKGKKVEKRDLCVWTSQALEKALLERNIKSGFKKTGIFPLDKQAVANSLLPSAGFEQGEGEGHLEAEETSEESSSEGEGEEGRPWRRERVAANAAAQSKSTVQTS